MNKMFALLLQVFLFLFFFIFSCIFSAFVQSSLFWNSWFFSFFDSSIWLWQSLENVNFTKEKYWEEKLSIRKSICFSVSTVYWYMTQVKSQCCKDFSKSLLECISNKDLKTSFDLMLNILVCCFQWHKNTKVFIKLG